MRTKLNLKVGHAALLLGISLVMGACAPLETQSGQPGGYPAPSTPMAGSPAPAATAVVATVPPVPTNPAITTPLAGETVQTGPIVSASNPQAALPYIWRTEAVQNADHTIFRLFIQYQGQEVQLGNDSGSAQYWSASSQYLAWSFEPTGLPVTFPIGLYVRVVATGKDVLIDSGQYAGFAVVDGDWVIHVSSAPPTIAAGNAIPRVTYRLDGYNLVTNQSVTVSTGIPEIPGRGLREFFGLSGSRAGWIEYDLQKRAYAMKLEDLPSGTVQTINVPLQQPARFSLSKNVIVWQDISWHGYSLERNTAFTIPYAPQEWEQTSGIIVVARDSAVEWDVPVGNAFQYYTASVINK